MTYDYFANDVKSGYLVYDICDFDRNGYLVIVSFNEQFILLDKHALINACV